MADRLLLCESTFYESGKELSTRCANQCHLECDMFLALLTPLVLASHI